MAGLSALLGAATISANTAPTLGTINSYSASGGALVITLPALSGVGNLGAYCIVEKNAADTTVNSITFNCSGADTFDDATTSLVLTHTGEKRVLQVVSISGTKYWKVTSFSPGTTASILYGTTNANSATQSQATSAGTNYYVTNSNLAVPTTLKVGTTFTWNVGMTKTAAGTGAFNIVIYRGTNGSISDTADVTQSIGTQTAAVDNMLVTVQVTVTTIGASGAYYWSIVPNNKAATATGFGVAVGTGAYFSGTVSSVALNTANLKLGLAFSSVTGTPTIAIPLVNAEANNIG
jgi:hypothetical protein